MEPRIDEMVLKVQQWLNLTYGDDSRFNRVEETGRTGWPTIYGLRRALQIELGITNTSNSFGPTTYSLCPNVNQGEEGNIVYIIQGGLWCKGYSPGGFTGYYGNGTYAAVKALKADMGFPTASGNMNRDIMRGLLDMSAFVCVSGGTEAIRSIQQQLNYDYYDYYQVCPCDGLYNREMNKMLIYALQKELGIAKSSATGTWGPTTISLCKAKSFNIGNSSPIVKLIRYAAVCNGFSVSTSSTTYDGALDTALENFAEYLLIPKTKGTVGYTVIKSLLSSNGDTDRSSIGCDTATKLTLAQIQTLKNAGYKYVGRYLTNTPGGTLDKCLTRTEIENILNAGLKVIYIFQESNNTSLDFSLTSGKTQAKKAIRAMDEFGAPNKAVIYFAVDFDPTDGEISSNIIPYFKGVIETLDQENVYYSVGVYGTRNVCQTLKNNFNTKIFTYVCDASYGFSGNLGFTMPSGWDFDQFAVDLQIGSGTSAVHIDKVAVSGRDSGEYGELRKPIHIENGERIYKPTASQKKLQGALYVNMHDSLHVYDKLRSNPADEETGYIAEQYSAPNEEDLMYTLPKYAMYLNIGAYKNETNGNSSLSLTDLIKFYDENTKTIRYGYIIKNEILDLGNYQEFNGQYTQQLKDDVKVYEYQREFTQYVVDDTHTKLVPSEKISINGSDKKYIEYVLLDSTTLHNMKGEEVGTLGKGTIIALENIPKSGANFNNLIFVYAVYDILKNKWVHPITKQEDLDTQIPELPNNAFIDYGLDRGCMPSNRIINN